MNSKEVDKIKERLDTAARLAAFMIALRKRLGLSQEAYSQRLGVGMMTVRRYEAGQCGDVSIDFLSSLAQVADVPVANVVNLVLGIEEKQDEIGAFFQQAPQKKRDRFSQSMSEEHSSLSAEEVLDHLTFYIRLRRLHQLEMTRDVLKTFLVENEAKISREQSIQVRDLLTDKLKAMYKEMLREEAELQSSVQG